jgi:hypothetical protein
MNTLLELLPTFLRAVADASVLYAPAYSTVISGVLTAGAALIERGEAAATELAALTTQIQAMVKAESDPTEADWAALKTASDTAHTQIQGG